MPGKQLFLSAILSAPISRHNLTLISRARAARSLFEFVGVGCCRVQDGSELLTWDQAPRPGAIVGRHVREAVTAAHCKESCRADDRCDAVEFTAGSAPSCWLFHHGAEQTLGLGCREHVGAVGRRLRGGGCGGGGDTMRCFSRKRVLKVAAVVSSVGERSSPLESVCLPLLSLEQVATSFTDAAEDAHQPFTLDKLVITVQDEVGALRELLRSRDVRVLDGSATELAQWWRAYSQHYVGGNITKYFGYIFKLLPLTMTEYNLVIVSDSDAFQWPADLQIKDLSHAQTARRGPLLMAQRLGPAAINSGFFLATPAKAWTRRIERALRRGFSPSSLFGGAYPPHEVEHVRQQSIAWWQQGAERICSVREWFDKHDQLCCYNTTTHGCYVLNWGDQGLLFHAGLAIDEHTTRFRWFTPSGPHFMGPSKPWSGWGGCDSAPRCAHNRVLLRQVLAGSRLARRDQQCSAAFAALQQKMDAADSFRS